MGISSHVFFKLKGYTAVSLSVPHCIRLGRDYMSTNLHDLFSNRL